ncbi:15841_t:CDS:2 [Funneliformis geosporum]|uniref:15841_t:CDS:1 n=1 Tax=Funneliformis geosporum TaxID=1117311 RepID=A0A9W4SNP7_9GLOM|nr:15841_t:CDS:2 [Funneliformis geosporum]
MSNNQQEESRNDDDGEGEMGMAYTTDEVDYLNHFSNNNPTINNENRNFATKNPVEYLEFLATQEPYSPKNLSLNQDSFHQPLQFQQKEQIIGIRGGPTLSNAHYVINYNPYFPPTHQIDKYNNPLSLSPLVHHSAAPYPDQSESYQIENDGETSSPIDHSAVTPSPLALPSLLLSRNRSRISTPKVEVSLNLPSAYTAQVQQSDSPLRSEFRQSELGLYNNNINVHKIRLSEILNEKRLSDQKLVSIMKNTSSQNSKNESVVKFDFHNATGDPDDPLLNNENISGLQEQQQRRLPTGLLNGNSNDNNNIIYNSNNISNTSQQQQYSNVPQPIPPISSTYPIPPTSQITPINQLPLIANKSDDDQNHDAIASTANIEDIEIKIYKPKQGTIYMLINIFTIAAIVFITWRLGDWGVGQAKEIYGTLKVLVI